MDIKKSYFKYLNHFRATHTINELYRKDNPNMISLRHDVDHNIEAAVEMSRLEKERGFRSTYFVLPTADYWKEKNFLNKVFQIQDNGHEIGLHINIIKQWYQNDCDDPKMLLLSQLQFLRNVVTINGVSTHGDKLCYQHNFINYWLFLELKPNDPKKEENGKNGEGLLSETKKYFITYPENSKLSREDGKSLDLWSISLKEFNLNYEAMHLKYDRYFTDSGGKWKRSPDPLTQDLSFGRTQILIHPWWWRD